MRKGIGLLKYRVDLQENSLKGLGFLLFVLGLGFKGNMELCLGELEHLEAKVKHSSVRLQSSLSYLGLVN